MALYYELPVYRDTYNLILKIYKCTKNFPKEYKYTLGQDMKCDALQLVRSIYRANKICSEKDKIVWNDFEQGRVSGTGSAGVRPMDGPNNPCPPAIF